MMANESGKIKIYIVYLIINHFFLFLIKINIYYGDRYELGIVKFINQYE